MKLFRVQHHLAIMIFILLASIFHEVLADELYNKVNKTLPEEDDSNTCTYKYFCTPKINMTELPQPPKFENPCTPEDVLRTYYTSQERSAVIINWTEPVATDGNGDEPIVMQLQGGATGGVFSGTVSGQTHNIVYLANDTDGLIDICVFDFTVIVPSCAKLAVVQNGRYICTNSTALGSSCKLLCDDGFRPSESGNATCRYESKTSKFPNWEHVQHCKEISCGNVTVPENATITCSTDNSIYKTMCKINCEKGLQAVGPMYSTCQTNGYWSEIGKCTGQEFNETGCSPGSCSGHGCLKIQNEALTCTCLHGWSGFICEIPPNYCEDNICMNNSTCTSLKENYTCTCLEGYHGSICQTSPINGQWSEWSYWTTCSSACGSGVQTRNRSCNNPPPDANGEACFGSHTEELDCENKTCQECAALNQINDSLTLIECEVEPYSGLQTCNVTCKNGSIHMPWLKEFEILRCGWESNNSWVPGNVISPCVVPVLPSALQLVVEITYLTRIPVEKQSPVQRQIMQNMKETKCINSKDCNISLAFSSKGSKTKLLTTFRRHVLEANVNTEDSARQKVKAAVVELESTADHITNSPGVFNINISDGIFLANSSSLKIQDYVECKQGHVPVNELCISCPAGTSIKSNLCYFCPKGTYQGLSGQTSCNPCPTGHTTQTVGCFDFAQCFRYGYEDDAFDLEDGSFLATIFGALAGVIATIATVATTYISIKQYRKKEYNLKNQHKDGESGSPGAEYHRSRSDERSADNYDQIKTERKEENT